jgi:hypothetical protein
LACVTSDGRRGDRQQLYRLVSTNDWPPILEGWGLRSVRSIPSFLGGGSQRAAPFRSVGRGRIDLAQASQPGLMILQSPEEEQDAQVCFVRRSCSSPVDGSRPAQQCLPGLLSARRDWLSLVSTPLGSGLDLPAPLRLPARPLLVLLISVRRRRATTRRH